MVRGFRQIHYKSAFLRNSGMISRRCYGTEATMTTPTGDSLRDLAESTKAFFERFGVILQMADAVKNFREEVGELIEAAERGEDTAHMAEEAADVMVTAIAVCFVAGISVDQIVAQVYRVIAKNDAKTHATHVHSDGKIRRRN
jgi:NTP pyrophosphatase (non-canonical NTP hydrolase)